MRVLILGNFDMGLYKFRKELIQKLLEEEYEVVISSPKGKYIDSLEQMGCRCVEVSFDRHGKNPFAELKLLRYYKKLIARERPDMIFSYTIKPNIYGALAAEKYKIPIAVNITGLGTAVENPGIMQEIIVALYRRAFRKVQTVFVQNSENKKFMIDKRIAVDRIKLLPGSGVNLEEYHILEYPNDEKIAFAFIARIMKEKGIEQYLDAAEKIQEKYPQTEFHICGFCEEEYEERIKRYEKEKVIIYHGLLMDIKEILKQVHCVVLPTYYPEGVSNILLESCACGRPIITTNRSGCREAVDDGINGFMIPQRDTQALIAAIEKFLGLSNEKRKNMGLAGRRKVEKEFDRKLVVSTYLSEIGKQT